MAAKFAKHKVMIATRKSDKAERLRFRSGNIADHKSNLIHDVFDIPLRCRVHLLPTPSLFHRKENDSSELTCSKRCGSVIAI